MTSLSQKVEAETLLEEGGKQQAESAPGACSFDLAMPPYLNDLANTAEYCGSYHKDGSTGLPTVIYMFFQLCCRSLKVLALLSLVEQRE